MKIKKGDKVAIYMGDSEDDLPFEAEIIDINDEIVGIKIYGYSSIEVKIIKEDMQFGIPSIKTNILYGESMVEIFKDMKSLYLFLSRFYKDKSKQIMAISKNYQQEYKKLKGNSK